MLTDRTDLRLVHHGEVVAAQLDDLQVVDDPGPAAVGVHVGVPRLELDGAVGRSIRAAEEAGTSVGGTFCVVAAGLVPGLGGYASGADRLTSRLGAAVLSVPIPARPIRIFLHVLAGVS